MNLKFPKIQNFFSSLDKSTWNVVRFGDVAIQQKESVNRENTDLERYVAGDHMDTNDLHIRRYGEFDGSYVGPAFHRKFESGDILYGSRRTYLRKVAVADFDGITANTTFVIKANKELIEPRLLPFIMLSENFAQHSIQNSKGSTNPYINWKDIAGYEFRLPPMDVQKKLAELLWAVDGNIEAITDAGSKIKVLYRSLIKQFLLDYIIESKLKMQKIRTPLQTTIEERKIPSSWKVCTIGEIIGEYQNGFAEGERAGSGISQLRMNNINIDGTLNLNTITTIPRKKGFEKYLLRKKDVLFDNTNSADLVGKSIIWNGEISEMVFSNHFTRLRVKEDLMLPKFLHIWLLYHFEIGLFQQRCVRWVGQASLQTRDLLSFQILVPPLSEQKIALEKLQHIEDLISVSQSEIQSGKNLQMTLINSIF